MAARPAKNQERWSAQERLRKELEIGRRIQEELLPRRPLLRASFAEIGGLSIPAREVGGDFFNYFPLREGEVAILLGDVSGKGVPAALLMANLQATLRARLALEPDLARLVDALDREMGSEEPLAPYVTLFLAVLEGQSGAPALRQRRAQHPVRARGATARPSSSSSSGRPAGPVPGRRLRGARRSRCGDGDALFLFTDGIVEAEDESGRAVRHGASRGAAQGPPARRASSRSWGGSTRRCGPTADPRGRRRRDHARAAVRGRAREAPRREARPRRPRRPRAGPGGGRRRASTGPPPPGTPRSAGSRWRSWSARTSGPAPPGTASRRSTAACATCRRPTSAACASRRASGATLLAIAPELVRPLRVRGADLRPRDDRSRGARGGPAR